MGSLGLPEMIVVLAIALLVFGSKKLPDLARGIGQAVKGFKEAAAEDVDKKTTTKAP
jgi:sec-independent protein translocase protein TatA